MLLCRCLHGILSRRFHIDLSDVRSTSLNRGKSPRQVPGKGWHLRIIRILISISRTLVRSKNLGQIMRNPMKSPKRQLPSSCCSMFFVETYERLLDFSILDPSQELLDIERCCASMPVTGFQRPMTGGPSDSPCPTFSGTCGTNGSGMNRQGAVDLNHWSRGRSKEASQLELPELLGDSKPLGCVATL